MAATTTTTAASSSSKPLMEKPLSLRLTMSLPTDEGSGASIVSNMCGGTPAGSDSSDATSNPPKRQRLESPALQSGAHFKGVVFQQNGHWDAQMYADHLCLSLGAFKNDDYAAAAVRRRRGDQNRNFPSAGPAASLYERIFQRQPSTDLVLQMIRDDSHEYSKQLAGVTSSSAAAASLSPSDAVVTEMFQKELTPSDVGKLNRLVIPKKHAVRHLPAVHGEAAGEEVQRRQEGDLSEGVMLEVRDREGRRWEFRYCYWKSSQSFVFTKGWNKFVKAKQLRTRDTVAFYRCEESGGEGPFCMIDVERASRVGGDGERAAAAEEGGEKQKGVWLFGVKISS